METSAGRGPIRFRICLCQDQRDCDDDRFYGTPYSNVRYCQIFPGECTESFQEGLKRAFHFLGGVPTLIKFDNSKVAVRKIVGMRGQEPTREFLRIASHFLFKHHFCRVRQPQEKGHVENAVGYSRRKYMVPMPELTDFETFNRKLEERCRDDMQKTSPRPVKNPAQGSTSRSCGF